MNAKLYAIIGLLLILIGGGLYANHLRSKVASQATRITDLEATEKGLRDGQKAVEDTAAKRIEATKAMGDIKRDIAVEEDAPLPAPIERALDGLREHQKRRNTPVSPAVR